MGMAWSTAVPARQARAVELLANDVLTIACPHGRQVADLIAFDGANRNEYLSINHTRNMLWRFDLKVGDSLFSNERKAMFEIIRDDTGTHDMLCVACDRMRYLLDYGVSDHANCVDNFHLALRQFDVPRNWLPDPINVFQNAPVQADGLLTILPSKAEPGDQFVLRALRDCLVAVSACPQDLAATNDYLPKAIELRVTRPSPSLGGDER